MFTEQSLKNELKVAYLHLKFGACVCLRADHCVGGVYLNSDIRRIGLAVVLRGLKNMTNLVERS